MTTDQKQLDDLLVPEDDLHEGVLTDAIGSYVQIGQDSGAFIPTNEFSQLSANAQTLVALLYQKAGYELGLNDAEKVTPLEISETTGLNHNTVKGAVRKLKELNLVQSDDGSYWVPTYNYQNVKEYIEEEG